MYCCFVVLVHVVCFLLLEFDADDVVGFLRLRLVVAFAVASDCFSAGRHGSVVASVVASFSLWRVGWLTGGSVRGSLPCLSMSGALG